MEMAVCAVPLSSLRQEPSHRSEMVSQLVFGETCTILEETELWNKIQCTHDGYEGWCQSSQLLSILSPENSNEIRFAAKWINEVKMAGKSMYVPMGASLETFSANTASWNGSIVEFNEEPVAILPPEEVAIRERAYMYINTPYLWGGRSVFGIDCSGFCQQLFGFFGMKLKRDASMQAEQGGLIGFLQEARLGDLAFFDNEAERIIHVGMLLNEHEIIHASGKVRIDHIDSAGIINVDSGERTHKLRLIKRYFDYDNPVAWRW